MKTKYVLAALAPWVVFLIMYGLNHRAPTPTPIPVTEFHANPASWITWNDRERTLDISQDAPDDILITFHFIGRTPCGPGCDHLERVLRMVNVGELRRNEWKRQ